MRNCFGEIRDKPINQNGVEITIDKTLVSIKPFYISIIKVIFIFVAVNVL